LAAKIKWHWASASLDPALDILVLQEKKTMPRTRRSLFYLASYLTITGLALLLAPQFTLKLLFANHQYPGAFVQFSGILMLGLAVVVMNIIKYGNRVLYRTTLMARIIMWSCILGLYFYTREAFFIVVLCVLGLGIVLTGSSYLSECGKSESAS
jgi:hypothetical protein